jgi:hypothetical protein
MRGILVGLALLLSLGAALPAAGFDAESEAHYQALLAQAKAGGLKPIDWQALRFAYSNSAEFDLFGTRTDAARKAMFAAVNARDFKAAIVQAGLIIDQDYVDIDAHVVLDLASEQLGDTAAAKREHEIVVGLLQSIRTGDGSSQDEAFTVIMVGEEYAMMRAFGFAVESQALAPSGGHSYDLLHVVDADGKARIIFFQIDRVIAAEADASGAAPRAQNPTP